MREPRLFSWMGISIEIERPCTIATFSNGLYCRTKSQIRQRYILGTCAIWIGAGRRWQEIRHSLGGYRPSLLDSIISNNEDDKNDDNNNIDLLSRRRTFLNGIGSMMGGMTFSLLISTADPQMAMAAVDNNTNNSNNSNNVHVVASILAAAMNNPPSFNLDVRSATPNLFSCSH